MVPEHEQHRSHREFAGPGTERAMIVFVSTSAEDARPFRDIVGRSNWLVVSVPDLTAARAAIEQLRPRWVVCDTEIEGEGSWRDLLKWRGALPGFALIVVSRLAEVVLWAEVLNLGGYDLLEKPFVVQEVERFIGLES